VFGVEDDGEARRLAADLIGVDQDAVSWADGQDGVRSAEVVGADVQLSVGQVQGAVVDEVSARRGAVGSGHGDPHGHDLGDRPKQQVGVVGGDRVVDVVVQLVRRPVGRADVEQAIVQGHLDDERGAHPRSCRADA
jgi:hypothetical protein